MQNFHVNSLDLQTNEGESNNIASGATEDATAPSISVNAQHELEDQEVLAQIRRSPNFGQLFTRLWAGDTKDFISHTAGVEELCFMLAVYAHNDDQQIDRLFRQSGLVDSTPNWNDEVKNCGPIYSTHGQLLIARAIERNNLDETSSPSVAGWDDVVSLDNESDVPPFPTDCLPTWVQRFVIEASESLQTPQDLVAMYVLPIAAAALATRYVAVFRDDWIEPLNIFAVAVLPVGERKSAALRLVAEPVHAIERQINDEMRLQLQKNIHDRNILEKRISVLETKFSKCEDEDEAKKIDIQ